MKYLCLALAMVVTQSAAQDWVNLWSPTVGNRAGHDIVVTDAGEVFAVGMTPIGSQPPFQRAAVVKYSASSGERQWVRYFDVPAAYGDHRSRLALLPGGVVGVTCAAGSNGDGVLTVFACSRDGDSLWQHSHDTGGYGGDRPCDIATDPSGNVYVTGPTATDSTGWDIYTAKFSPQGQLAWERRFDGPAHQDDDGTGIVLDDAGNAYVAGAVWNALLKQRPTILKYSSSGSLVWTKLLGPEGGTSSSYNDIALGRGECLYAAGQGRLSTWGPIAKYSLGGDSLWADSLSGEVLAVATDDAGNLYAAGSVVREACIRKLSSAGALLWERRLQDWPQSSAGATDLKVVGTDGVAAAGYTTGEETQCDLMVARYSAVGDSLWVGKYHRGRIDYAGGVAVDTQGNVYVTGVCTDGYRLAWVTVKYPPSGPGIEEPRAGRWPRGGRLVVEPSVVHSNCEITLTGQDAPARLRVSDLAGRTVAELPVTRPGTSARWNLTDADGRLVPNGVYFAVAELPGSRATARFVVQR